MADESKLSALHDKVAEVLTEALDGQTMPDYVDPETGEVEPGGKLAPSAAIIAVAAKFLKDNNITCVPSEDNKLGELEAKMKARQEKRRNRANPTDLANAAEQATWLGGQIGNA